MIYYLLSYPTIQEESSRLKQHERTVSHQFRTSYDLHIDANYKIGDINMKQNIFRRNICNGGDSQ